MIYRSMSIWTTTLALAALQGACSEAPQRPRQDGRLDDVGAVDLVDVGTAPDVGSLGDTIHDSSPSPDAAVADGTTTADTGGPTGTVIPKAYITGYSWFDNTPPGSATISHPQIHQTAGGTGTWADPITLAVGHDLSSGQDVLDYPAGSRFYIPDFKRYFIVEDTCGDGPTPENGPCHVPPSGATTWLDVWIGGESGTRSSTDACMSKLTGIHQVVLDPDASRPVSAGEIFSGGACQI
jgi:hypothetical protein